MFFDKLTGDEDEPILELLNQISTDKKEEKKEKEAVDAEEAIDSKKEKDTINIQEIRYRDDLNELNLITIGIFKALEKLLYDVAKGNIGLPLIKSLISFGGILFSARKLYTKKRFLLRQQDRMPLLNLYKRLYTFNRLNLINTMAPTDRIKKQQYLQYLNK